MIILRLTNKVLKEFGKEKPMLGEVEEEASSIGEWYVHLFYFSRQKCLIFTNAGSLFSFVVHGVSRKDIKNIENLFRRELSRALFDENFNAQEMKNIMDNINEAKFAKTANRSVLGSMNDLIRHYEYLKSRSMVQGDMDDAGLQCEINKTPMSALKYDYPIERFKEMVTGKKIERPGRAQKFGSQNSAAYIFNAQMTQYSEGENIMRQVAVSGNKNLLHLAQVILNAFDFDCDHCFGFYGDIHKHPGREQTEIYEAFVDADVEPTNDLAKSVERTRIATVFKDVGKKMLFMFDYGQDWRFAVELKEIQKGSTEKLPKVLSSIGVAPPQYPPLDEK